MTAVDLTEKYPLASDEKIRASFSGDPCRCTGYLHLIEALCSVVARRARGVN